MFLMPTNKVRIEPIHMFVRDFLVSTSFLVLVITPSILLSASTFWWIVRTITRAIFDSSRWHIRSVKYGKKKGRPKSRPVQNHLGDINEIPNFGFVRFGVRDQFQIGFRDLWSRF